MLKATEPLRGHEQNINNGNTTGRIATRPVVFVHDRSWSNTTGRVSIRRVVFEYDRSYLNTTGRVCTQRSMADVLQWESVIHNRCGLHVASQIADEKVCRSTVEYTEYTG